jgi:lipoprotein-anchoring transpeptidase ErfK/SrfK
MSNKSVLSVLVTLAIASAAPAALARAHPRHAHRTPTPSPSPAKLTPEAVNDAGLTTPVGPNSRGAAVLRAEVLLDRANFSPGEIDGGYGSNVRKAIAGYQSSNGLPASGTVDKDTWAALNRDAAPVLTTYTITAEDVAGPFTPIPSDMMEKAALPALGYASPLEALGERFHASPRLLQRLNPGKDFATAGQAIVVPSVGTPAPIANAAKVVVDKSDSVVMLVDAGGKVLAQYPATTGSSHDPLPLGDWKIRGVSRNPEFHYNPALFWDAKPTHDKATIAPGPNNPVGVVWIDLSKPHYGIHGTPEPSTISKTQSHGCIRVTNWNALSLAQSVSPGMPAILQE